MTTLRILLTVGLAAAAIYLVLGTRPGATDAGTGAVSDAVFQQLVPTDAREDTVRVVGEAELFMDAARRAWQYVDAAYQPATGLVQPVPEYALATIWDIASALAAFHSAETLGLLTPDEYELRTARTLRTLTEMPLFDGAAFNKTYSVRDGVMAGRDGAPSARGYGWSALDLGRLLVWLHIIRTQRPRLAAAAEEVAERLDFERIVRDGYIHGAELGRGGRTRSYQEGRIGYEQYAAVGFALWSKPALLADNWRENAMRTEVLDQAVLQDRRPNACLTSEPFLLLGLELGWNPLAFPLALGLLNVQRERWRRTGTITLVSEDASADPPHYFHYYCALLDDVPFGVTAQGRPLLPAGPRTVSTKAAFAWYALAPNAYTKLALETVVAALSNSEGWPAGIYEESHRPSGPQNVNTAAVILEAAAFARSRRPLLMARR